MYIDLHRSLGDKGRRRRDKVGEPPEYNSTYKQLHGYHTVACSMHSLIE
jgi:hypothetical protein